MFALFFFNQWSFCTSVRWSTLIPTDGWFLIKSRGAFFTGYLSDLGQPLVKDWNAWHGQASTGCRVQWGNTKLSYIKESDRS